MGVTAGTLVCYGHLEDYDCERDEWDNGPIHMFLMSLDTWEWDIVDLIVLGTEYGADLADTTDFRVDSVSGRVVAKSENQVWSYDVETGDVTLLPASSPEPSEEMVLGRTVVTRYDRNSVILFSDLVSGEVVHTTGEGDGSEGEEGERGSSEWEGDTDEEGYFSDVVDSDDDGSDAYTHLTQMGQGSVTLLRLHTRWNGITRAELLHIELEVAVDVTAYAKWGVE
ncbi:hypothetical protein KIPB_005182 [Kipferlia bialata]|uniref:Uncharacterized protein n=1 Tax=Kipferlia bialata TaxID=797122 RepID=A0A9K3CV00_9EUKA|nr:hypothetical protein KIPB_005182 [Kipferlia bialata]|eukprot:g5182.t1